MRHVLSLALGLALGALAVHAASSRAFGEDAPAPAPAPAPAADPSDPGARIDVLTQRFERETAVLRAEVEFLRSREEALTKYVLGMSGTSTAMRTNIAIARREGFEAAAISAPSRIAVLHALDQFANDLTGALPVPTSNEIALHRKIEELRRAAGTR